MFQEMKMPSHWCIFHQVFLFWFSTEIWYFYFPSFFTSWSSLWSEMSFWFQFSLLLQTLMHLWPFKSSVAMYPTTCANWLYCHPLWILTHLALLKPNLFETILLLNHFMSQTITVSSVDHLSFRPMTLFSLTSSSSWIIATSCPSQMLSEELFFTLLYTEDFPSMPLCFSVLAFCICTFFFLTGRECPVISHPSDCVVSVLANFTSSDLFLFDFFMTM